MTQQRYILRIDADDLEAANEDALQYDPAGGDHTFEIGLSATGEAPATHYVRRMLIPDDIIAEIQALNATKYPTAIVEEWDMDADPGKPERLFEEWELILVSE